MTAATALEIRCIVAASKVRCEHCLLGAARSRLHQRSRTQPWLRPGRLRNLAAQVRGEAYVMAYADEFYLVGVSAQSRSCRASARTSEQSAQSSLK
jgi:hypothetical protein